MTQICDMKNINSFQTLPESYSTPKIESPNLGNEGCACKSHADPSGPPPKPRARVMGTAFIF